MSFSLNDLNDLFSIVQKMQVQIGDQDQRLRALTKEMEDLKKDMAENTKEQTQAAVEALVENMKKHMDSFMDQYGTKVRTHVFVYVWADHVFMFMLTG